MSSGPLFLLLTTQGRLAGVMWEQRPAGAETFQRGILPLLAELAAHLSDLSSTPTLREALLDLSSPTTVTG